MGGGHPFVISRYLFLDTFSMNNMMIRFDAKLRISIPRRDFAHWIACGNQTMKCKPASIWCLGGRLMGQ